MNRILSISLFTCLVSTAASAQEIKGGWVQCEYLGHDPQYNTSTFKITMYNYQNGPFATAGPFGFFHYYDAVTGAEIKTLSKGIHIRGYSISNMFSPCPNGDSSNNFSRVRTYAETINMLDTSAVKGFFVATYFYDRDSTLTNIIFPNSSSMLYKATIPGTIAGINYHTNNSPTISDIDNLTICAGSSFTIPIIAYDKDGDSLSYSFGNAMQGIVTPPEVPVQYVSPFNGLQPMGNTVTINPVTGIIAGTAPTIAGGYLIAVYVKEWRNGVLINTTRKESFIKVVHCKFNSPLLKPSYITCNFLPISFEAQSTCPPIMTYTWDFGVPGILSDTSHDIMPSYTYTTPGKYIVKLWVTGEQGYADSATAELTVLSALTIDLPGMIELCRTDTITLQPNSDGQQYLWTETGGGTTLNNYTIKNPVAMPTADSTTYLVHAKLGACFGVGKTTIYTSPYPKANAGVDTFICFSGSVPLKGSFTGASYSWYPLFDLQNVNTLNPIASPSKTTTYYLYAKDTFHCKKAAIDTVNVKVIPPFTITASSNNPIVSKAAPFSLKASGDTATLQYEWQPSSYFNNNKVYNPVATVSSTPPNQIAFTVKASTIEGCSAVATTSVKVYDVGPDILIPTAFTPNKDGKNDVLKPILIGIDRLYYFKVYNRFGQIIYETSDANKGWDGTLRGILQSGGVFVVIAQGKDYLGRTILKKETVLLIE